eukprot:TRINITY_DN73751_c1_g1_i1.p3 TRINITY_DN73751_c1_g1~~TRINITY_DN73751_c1_g1_i1.p3  ORF type:complete len:109 (+),score=23.66 TRINITY_DN73751_c1_g1_i1:28-327(+)
MAEAFEVLLEAEDLVVVDAQPFPDRVASLDGGVEGADAGSVAVDQLAIDVDEQVFVLLVECLEHGGGQRSGVGFVGADAEFVELAVGLVALYPQWVSAE